MDLHEIVIKRMSAREVATFQIYFTVPFLGTPCTLNRQHIYITGWHTPRSSHCCVHKIVPLYHIHICSLVIKLHLFKISICFSPDRLTDVQVLVCYSTLCIFRSCSGSCCRSCTRMHCLNPSTWCSSSWLHCQMKTCHSRTTSRRGKCSMY